MYTNITKSEIIYKCAQTKYMLEDLKTELIPKNKILTSRLYWKMNKNKKCKFILIKAMNLKNK
jgi:hypothetical protein